VTGGTSIPIGAVIGGCVGGVAVLIILVFRSRKVEHRSAIAEIRTAFHVDEIETGIRGPYEEPIPSDIVVARLVCRSDDTPDFQKQTGDNI
jgi:hypothetical protein